MSASVAASPSSSHGFWVDDSTRQGLDISASFEQEESDLHQMILARNKDGLDLLREGQYRPAFEQLKYAEAVLEAKFGSTEEPSILVATTCCNLGCYYKKIGKLHAALSYLRKALKIELSLQTDDTTVAETHLDICAILSKLDKHGKAIKHAECALRLIEGRVSSGLGSSSDKDYSMLAVAYHNLAVEHEHLQQWEEAASAYQQGHQVAKRCLGDQHPLTQTMGKNSEIVQKKTQKFCRGRPLSPIANELGSRRSLKSLMTEDSVESSNTSSAVLPDIPSSGVSRAMPSGCGGNLRHPNTTAAPDPAEWQNAQNQTAPVWRSAQLPPIGMTSPSAFNPHGGAEFFPSPPEMSMTNVVARANPAWPLKPPQYHTAASYLDQVMQDVPAVALLTEAPPSPPPLVYNSKVDVGSAQKLRRVIPDGRVLGRPPRIQRPCRTTGVASETRQPFEQGKRVENAILRRSATTKIQHFFRKWRKNRHQYQGRSEAACSAATKIQARWRGFRVVRGKQNAVATLIQKRMQGFLVRRRKRKRLAAITIQRTFRGMIQRQDLAKKHAAAVKVQRHFRMHFEKVLYMAVQAKRAASVLRIQRAERRKQAYRMVGSLRASRDLVVARGHSAISIQSFYRGCVGRRRAKNSKKEMMVFKIRNYAAIRIQASVRKNIAKIHRDDMLRMKNKQKASAATVIRKHWLRYRCQKRYRHLKKEFLHHVPAIIQIQRHARGFLTRLRIWRDALRHEQEFWASVECQRCWRGFLGRKKFKNEYAAVHNRANTAIRLQGFIRGWLARTRIHRKRKAIARAEFQKARKRFKAAQKIQAVARGVQCRSRQSVLIRKMLEATTKIQTVYRGHTTRTRLWQQLVRRRVIRIQAVARGFLVRHRRHNMLTKLICIQTFYRRRVKWIPKEERDRCRLRSKANSRKV